MTKVLSFREFLRTLPTPLISYLPVALQTIQVRQPFGRIIQFHFGEPRLHYEVALISRERGFELGLHFEARDKQLNRYLLWGFRRHLFEIKDTLGNDVVAERWDKGWAKVYRVYPSATLTTAYQSEIAQHLANMICCLHPIFVELRRDVTRLHR